MRTRLLSPRLVVTLLALSLMPANLEPAKADSGFRQWIQDFYSVARKSGVSRQTYNAVFAGVTSPDPEVIQAANYQPEFKSKFWEYLDTRITERSIRTGLEMKEKYKQEKLFKG